MTLQIDDSTQHTRTVRQRNKFKQNSNTFQAIEGKLTNMWLNYMYDDEATTLTKKKEIYNDNDCEQRNKRTGADV